MKFEGYCENNFLDFSFDILHFDKWFVLMFSFVIFWYFSNHRFEFYKLMSG